MADAIPYGLLRREEVVVGDISRPLPSPASKPMTPPQHA